MPDTYTNNLLTCFALSELAIGALDKLGLTTDLPAVNKEVTDMITVTIQRAILAEAQ